MTTSVQSQMQSIETLRLPELQARFAEIVGETTRCPNRRFLLRRIAKVLEASSQTIASVEEQALSTEQPIVGQSVSSVEARPARGRFKSMTIEELRAKYLEVVGRVTGSADRRYLLWKIRQAEKGRVPVGPRKSCPRDSEPLDMKILPLRLDAAAIDKMDEAWRSRGIKSRMAFLRGAIGHYLAHLGDADAAKFFTNEGPTAA
jgi:hypothetical protein